MISFFSKYRKGIFIGTVVIFMIGIFVGLGGYLFSGSRTSEAVAVVGSEKIPYQKFRLQVGRMTDRMKDSGTEVTEAVAERVKQEVLREMIVEEILCQQGEKAGLKVSDFEVAAEIQNTPQFQREGVFDPGIYFQTVWQQMRMKPEEYEAWRKRARLALKFRQLVFGGIKLSPSEIEEYYVKKNGSLRNFAKEKEKFAQEMTQERFVQLINYMLRQITVQSEIKTFLEQREKGL